VHSDGALVVFQKGFPDEIPLDLDTPFDLDGHSTRVFQNSAAILTQPVRDVRYN
jgi:hypothetical protein